MGGRDAEMTFGIGKIAYTNLYLHDYATYGTENAAAINAASKDGGGTLDATVLAEVKEYLRTDTIVEGAAYEVQKVSDAKGAAGASDDEDNEFLNFGATDKNATDDANSVTAGDKFTATASGTLVEQGTGTNYNWVLKQEGQLLYAASEGIRQNATAHGSTTEAVDTNMLTAQIEDVQAKINTARVQAGSQYAAIESAVSYTTDLTAQYELGFNTVNDVNFSMETAHLAKNQILQQAATAMLAQANQGQQGLLQLIQG